MFFFLFFFLSSFFGGLVIEINVKHSYYGKSKLTSPCCSAELELKLRKLTPTSQSELELKSGKSWLAS